MPCHHALAEALRAYIERTRLVLRSGRAVEGLKSLRRRGGKSTTTPDFFD
jgi:hypothetical protein